MLPHVNLNSAALMRYRGIDLNSFTKNSDDVDDNCMSFVWFQQDTSLV